MMFARTIPVLASVLAIGLGIALASCAPTATPLIAGVGLKLDDASKSVDALSYRDLENALFLATSEGAHDQIAAATTSSQFAGGALTIWFGLDATRTIATSMKARFRDGAVVDVGAHAVDTTSLDGAADGGAISFEAAGDSDATVNVVMAQASGARVLATNASKAKEKWSPSGALVVAAKTLNAAGKSTSSVTAYDAVGDHALCADHCAREVAVTRDGTRVVLFANDKNNAGTLEIVDVAGLHASILAANASDQRIRLDEDDAGGARAYFLGVDGSIQSVGLDAIGARTIKAAGAVDILDAKNGVVVYASSIDPATGLASIGVAHAGGDVALGANAVGEGFSGDGRFYAFRDAVTFDAKQHANGTLRMFDTTTATTRTLSPQVRKAQIAGDAIVWIDATKHLKRAAMTGAPELVQINVDSFDVLARDTQKPALVYSIPAELNAGIWRTDP